MERMRIVENMEGFEEFENVQFVEAYVEYADDIGDVEEVSYQGDVENEESFNYVPQVEERVRPEEYRDDVLAEVERLLDVYESRVDYDDEVMLEYLDEINYNITNLCYETQEIKYVPSTVHIYPFVLRNTLEDRALREKYYQFSKFIEPIQRVADQLAPDDTRHSELSGLLKVLLNPSRKIRLKALSAVEEVLKKISEIHNTFKSINLVKEFTIFLQVALLKPDGSHLIRKTFRPTKQYFDSEIRLFSRRMPYFRSENIQKDNIPHALKGEILMLDERFRVTLDPSVHSNKSVNLICYLLDKELPCVPPIAVVVPEHYPSDPLDCSFSEHEYSASMFLKTVKEIFSVRLMQLPKYSSLTRLLEVWEMAVRKACSPKANVNVVNDLSEIFGM